MKVCVSVIHVVASLDTKQGGPSRTVTHLVDALSAESGLNMTLLAQCAEGAPNVVSRSALVDRRELTPSSSVAATLGLPVKRELSHLVQSDQLILLHNHGLWLPVNHWVSRAARKRGLPLVIHPRGMLEPWAMGHRAWKKRLAMVLYQRNDLKAASVIIVTSHEEYRNVRALGFDNPIAVIPNGIELPARITMKAETMARPGTRSVLFLSRIHRIKGLINLLRAWSQVIPDGWRLHIVGPDEDGHLAEVMKEAEQLGVSPFIDYTGEVTDDEKTAIYQKSDLFVLPSFSENFGVVVAEALAHGLPVITTQGTPWSDLPKHGCGWWIEVGADPLACALREAVSLDDLSRMEMGRKAINYVHRFDWKVIAQDMAAVYRWILGLGEKPDCVRID